MATLVTLAAMRDVRAPAVVVLPAVAEVFTAAALCGVAGIYLGVVVRTFGAAPLVPVKDPFLPDSLEYDNG